MSKFVEAYASQTRVGTLTKESHTGKLVAEWEVLVKGLESKPEIVDIGSAVSSVMAVKDFEEMVRCPSDQILACFDCHKEKRPSGCCVDFDSFEASCCTQTRGNLRQGVQDHS